MISHKDRLFHQKKNKPLNNRINNVYNLFRNRITREIRKAKNEYYKIYFENNLSNMKKHGKASRKLSI